MALPRWIYEQMAALRGRSTETSGLEGEKYLGEGKRSKGVFPGWGDYYLSGENFGENPLGYTAGESPLLRGEDFRNIQNSYNGKE